MEHEGSERLSGQVIAPIVLNPSCPETRDRHLPASSIPWIAAVIWATTPGPFPTHAGHTGKSFRVAAFWFFAAYRNPSCIYTPASSPALRSSAAVAVQIETCWTKSCRRRSGRMYRAEDPGIRRSPAPIRWRTGSLRSCPGGLPGPSPHL